MPKLDRVTAEPAILGGKACIRGMRIAGFAPISASINDSQFKQAALLEGGYGERLA